MLSEIKKITSNHKDNICKDINESSYIQKNIKKNERYKDLTDLLISNNDPNIYCSSIKEKFLLLNQTRIKIASEIEENKEILKSFNFNKFLSLKKIQSGIMKKNTLSSLFFFSEYYKCKIVLIDKRKNIYYSTSKDYKEKIIIEQNGDYWELGNFSSKLSKSHIKEFNILEKDIVSYDIYEIPLKSMNSYKLKDLQELAQGNNIDFKNNGKNKNKTVLYEELREYYLNLI